MIIIGCVIHWFIYDADFGAFEKPALNGKENVSAGALEYPKPKEQPPANTSAGRNKSENLLNGLQVQAIKTGFYEHKDLSSLQVLYVPTVIQTNDSSLDYDIAVRKRQRMDDVIENDSDPMVEYDSTKKTCCLRNIPFPRGRTQ